MYITELMKMPNIAISVDEGLLITSKEGHYGISYQGSDALPITEDAKDLLRFIEQNQPSLIQLRQYIHDQNGSYHLILFISNLLNWHYLGLNITDAQNNILISVQYSNSFDMQTINLEDEVLVKQNSFVMSRFVYLARENSQTILAKPMQDKRFILRCKKIQGLIFSLFEGTSIDELSTQYKTDMHPSILLIIRMLFAENMLVTIDSKQSIPSRFEEGSDVDMQWDSADLLFHSSSRIGYHFGDFGGAFPFVNKIDPRPAVRDLPEGERIDLYQPDIKSLMKNDASLTQLQMQRLSVRQYNEKKPISSRQIGEFLYRTARVLFESEMQVTNIKDKVQKTNMGLAWRPYPTGGASYELEVYLTVDRSADLDPGMYYYAPKTHQLIKIREKNPDTEAIIDAAYVSCAQIVRPQVVLHIAARFQRVSWKYHAIAYATNLRNTGVLYQTFYLNAVAMGLAPCGLGGGNLKAFAAASGNDPLVEGNIGEFMLGSLPEGLDFSKIEQQDISKLHGAVNAGKSK